MAVKSCSCKQEDKKVLLASAKSTTVLERCELWPSNINNFPPSNSAVSLKKTFETIQWIVRLPSSLILSTCTLHYPDLRSSTYCTSVNPHTPHKATKNFQLQQHTCTVNIVFVDVATVLCGFLIPRRQSIFCWSISVGNPVSLTLKIFCGLFFICKRSTDDASLSKKSLITCSLRAYARFAGSGWPTLLVSSDFHLLSNSYIQSGPGFPFLNGLFPIITWITSCTMSATSISIPNPNPQVSELHEQ